MPDIICGGCKHLGKGKNSSYCLKYGHNLSGTLERSEKCKKEQGKEVKDD